MLAGCSAFATGESSGPTPTEILAGVVAPPPPWSGSASIRVVQNAVQIDARLNGSSARTFLLDSGAPTTIAPWLAAEAGIANDGDVELADPQGKTRAAPLATARGVELGRVRFEDVGAVIDWVEAPDPLACLSTAGLLGASLMRAGVWQIDFQSRNARFASSADGLPGLEYAMRLPFERGDAAGSPRVRVDLGATANVSVLIDLGFNGPIALPLDLFRRAGGRLPAGTPTQTGRSAATVLGDGSERVFIGRVPELRIGDLHLSDVPVLTGDQISDAHVGVAFLSHFRVTIDWVTDTLHLQRRSARDELRPRFDSYGFTPRWRDGTLVVGALWEGTEAAALLRIDDRIAAVEGVPVKTGDFAGYCRLLDEIGLYGSRSTPLELTIERGSTPETVTLMRRPLRRPRSPERP